MGTFEVLALVGGIAALIATIGIVSLRSASAPIARWREFPAPGSRPAAARDTLPVSIYLAAAEIHYPVQAATTRVLAAAGLRVHSAYDHSADDPVPGSWFRRLRAAVDSTPYAPAARGGTPADIRDHLLLAQDAAITSALLRNADAVITALEPTPDAIVHLGAVLIVKADGKSMVAALTAAQQARLDRDPDLATSPRLIASALGVTSRSTARAAVGAL
jgi:hypothetical protein